MIYIDSSCLVKIFRFEPGSSGVTEAVGREAAVIVSSLVELEVLVQLKAEYLGGNWSRPRWRRLETQFSLLRNQAPYEFRNLPAGIFQTALRQHRNSGDRHCRSLDRLHLAAMEELDVSRLMTHDVRQAKAAIEAGFEVIRPS
ncbi:MAG TPA: type II toxin-antitoxin system VapC family toxin [Candidatus Nitrosopolaris sp.]|nr:type II toxin-antitoxin system VapC family toxin [Candidatus Nitrosopolaris sp.]